MLEDLKVGAIFHHPATLKRHFRVPKLSCLLKNKEKKKSCSSVCACVEGGRECQDPLARLCENLISDKRLERNPQTSLPKR